MCRQAVRGFVGAVSEFLDECWGDDVVLRDQRGGGGGGAGAYVGG